MLKRTMRWVHDRVKEHDIKGRTLDIGSHNVNGGIISNFEDYIGIDLQGGRNVTMVMNAYDIYRTFERNSFDNVLCLYVLEHLPDIGEILKQVDFVLKRGGYFFISVPLFDYPIHSYPGEKAHDYWRFTEDTVKDVIMKGYEIVASEKGRGSRPGAGPVFDCLGRKL